MGGRGGASGVRGGGSADGVIMSGATKKLKQFTESKGDLVNLILKMKSWKQPQTVRAMLRFLTLRLIHTKKLPKQTAPTM